MRAAAGVRRRLTHSRLKAALLVLGLAGMAVAVVSLRHDLDGHALPGVTTMLLALAVSLACLVFAARAWITVLEADRADRPAVSSALYLSQLSKYLPGGGIVQATGQITLSAASHRPARRVAIAFVVAAASAASAGLVLAGFLVTLSGAPSWIRWLAPLAFLAPIMLTRPVLRFGLRTGRRITRHVPDVDHLPPPRAIGATFGWGILNIGCFGLSYAIILHSMVPDTPLLGAMSAFALAWVIGFLVLPVPSGLGVREAILYTALPGVPAAAVLASSLAHRVTTFAAEVMLTAISGVRQRVRQAAAADVPA